MFIHNHLSKIGITFLPITEMEMTFHRAEVTWLRPLS